MDCVDLHFNKIIWYHREEQLKAKDFIFHLKILVRLCIQGTDERGGKEVEMNKD